MDDKWIESIKDKMAEYDFIPPDGLLDAVEARVRARTMRRKRIFGAIAASVALMGVVSVALIPDMPDAASGPLVSDAAGEDKGKIFDERIAENTEGSRPLPITRKSGRTVLMSSMANHNDETIELFESEECREEKHSEDNHENAVENPHMDTESYISSKRVDDDRYPEEAVAILEIVDTRSRGHSPLSVRASVSANGLGGMLDEDNIEGGQPMASSSMPRTRMGGGILGESNSNNPPASTYVELFDHKLPVRASIVFSWPLRYNLNIDAGISYSYLRSDIRYGYSDFPLFKATQSLHFIGIPVNLRYVPLSFRKLDIYASAGFMAEKCISGQIKAENPQDPEYSYLGCDDRPFQFSVNAAVGLQYSLARSCAVFIEPGLGLYLKNSSPLRTIYSERPLTFTVNVGFRFGH